LRIFISHGSVNSDWAEWIASTLRKEGHEAFGYRDLKIGTGERWADILESEIRASEMTVVVASESYFNSLYAQYEWRASLERSIDSVIVARIEPVMIPSVMAGIISIDLYACEQGEARELLLSSVNPSIVGPVQKRSSSFPGYPYAVDVKKPPSINPAASGSSVFVSYSHKDRRWLDRLLVHLKPLERSGILDVWSDRRITPGLIWKHEIERALENARAAILLVSADFLASDFVVEHELPALLAMAQSKGTLILPLIVGPSRFTKNEELSKFQSFNSPGVPLSKMTINGREELLVLLVNRIEEIIAT
jgi:hypothetical protein